MADQNVLLFIYKDSELNQFESDWKHLQECCEQISATLRKISDIRTATA